MSMRCGTNDKFRHSFTWGEKSKNTSEMFLPKVLKVGSKLKVSGREGPLDIHPEVS